MIARIAPHIAIAIGLAIALAVLVGVLGGTASAAEVVESLVAGNSWTGIVGDMHYAGFSLN